MPQSHFCVEESQSPHGMVLLLDLVLQKDTSFPSVPCYFCVGVGAGAHVAQAELKLTM